MRIIWVACFCLGFGLLVADAPVSVAATNEFNVTATLRTDTASPTTPSPITATPIASTQIDVTWGASTDDVVLGGYQVFRDTVQIATTGRAVTTYEDTGLTPSTTYSYNVIAFDVSGKFSSSSAVVSTTTFDVPPPAPVATTSTSTASTVGGVRVPQLRGSTVTPGIVSATVEFRVSTPVRFELRVQEQGRQVIEQVIGTEVFRNEHTVILSDLTAGTSYDYELLGTDRFGRTVRLEEGTFTTLPEYSIATPVNVSGLQGSALGDSVYLQWQYPDDQRIAYVRVVRNHLFFPTDPTNGFVVYEGSADSFFDRNAFVTHESQYYTVYTYNTDGQRSSGAIVRVDKVTPGVVNDAEVVPGVVVADPNPVVPPSTPAEFIPSLQFSDIFIIQNGVILEPLNGQLMATTGSPFVVRIPEAVVSQSVRTPTIVLQHPSEQVQQFSYLLDKTSDGEYYEAYVPALTDAGPYPFRFTGYNRLLEIIQEVDGVLVLKEEMVTDEIVDENPIVVGGGYALLWGVIGLLVGTFLWWLLLLLKRLLRPRGHRDVRIR